MWTSRKINHLSLNGIDYSREVEMIDDIEVISWEIFKPVFIEQYSSELPFELIKITNQEELDRVELLYEESIINELMSTLPII